MTAPAYMRRYFFRLSGFMAGYIGALVGGLLMVRNGAPDLARIAVALLTTGMICGVFWAIFRLIAECDDEYQRYLLVKQVLLATGAMLAVTTLWQFLAVFGVVDTGPQWIGVVWLALFGIAAPIVRFRA